MKSAPNQFDLSRNLCCAMSQEYGGNTHMRQCAGGQAWDAQHSGTDMAASTFVFKRERQTRPLSRSIRPRCRPQKAHRWAAHRRPVL